MIINKIFVTTQSSRQQLIPNENHYTGDGVELTLSCTNKNNVYAYSINAKSSVPFDKFCAIEIHITPENDVCYMANRRHSEFWCKPEFYKSADQIDDLIQCLLSQKTDGKYSCMLPVCSKQYLSNIKGSQDGDIVVYMYSLCSSLTECNGLAFTITEGDMPYILVEDCAKYAIELLGTSIPTRDKRRYPELFEYLGWCSWDAFMVYVSEDKLLSKCKEFKDKNIPVKWAIIDDMWADCPNLKNAVGVERKEMFQIMHASHLRSFNADPERFPNGLKTCISRMKEYGMKVGMWHPTTGYWKGVDPEGEIMEEMPEVFIQSGYFSQKTGEYGKKNMLIHSPEFEKAFRFYNRWHSYFKECGAEFVKVDNQSFSHRIYHDIMPVGEVATNLHNAIECSTSIHFDNALINCMGASAENMWNRPQSSISRCSDDFQPENRDWFTKHILQCSYNCLVQGVFHVCDWDMWWTDDSQAIKNSVLRAISGGPVYVSDTLGRSRAEVLKPLCFDDGRILRTDRPATPINKCIFSDPENCGQPFTIWSSANDGAVIASFNLDCNNNQVVGDISIADIPCLKGEKFAAYDYFNKTAFILDSDGVIKLTLNDRDDFRLFTIVPITDGIGFIGLADKMSSPKAILNKTKNSALLYQGGQIAFISDKQIEKVAIDGKRVTPVKSGVLYTIDCDSKDNVLLSIE